VWRYYRFATIAAAFVLGLVAVYSVLTGNMQALLIVALLAVLEVSLSFDNALVNATYVGRLSSEWQQRFLRWGILIAVVGMRLLFPIAVVSLSGLISPLRVVVMAFTDPHAYANHLQHAHVPLVVFGGVYLLQIFLTFMLNAEEKEATWLKWLEKPLERIGEKSGKPALIVFAGASITVAVLSAAWSNHLTAVLIAGVSSIILYQTVSWIGGKFDEDEDGDAEDDSNTGKALTNLTGKAAFFTFCYLELQDAMFSFDGVMGAFAFTLIVALIMAGLCIGALYVRSMTIHLVDTGALAEFPYLGNGAFWAIGALPFAMWFGFPDLVTGGISVFLIGAALLHSVYDKRRGVFDATGKVVEGVASGAANA